MPNEAAIETFADETLNNTCSILSLQQTISYTFPKRTKEDDS